jgi:hypothetical protein
VFIFHKEKLNFYTFLSTLITLQYLTFSFFILYQNLSINYKFHLILIRYFYFNYSTLNLYFLLFHFLNFILIYNLINLDLYFQSFLFILFIPFFISFNQFIIFFYLHFHFHFHFLLLHHLLFNFFMPDLTFS